MDSKGFLPGWDCGEGGVIGRMPVLRENDVLEQRRDAMDGRNHLVSQGNGKRAAGAKVVLHIGDDENVVRIDLHVRLLSRKSLAQQLLMFLSVRRSLSGNGFITASVSDLTSDSSSAPLPLPLPELPSHGAGSSATELGTSRSESWRSFMRGVSKRTSGKPSFFLMASKSEACSSEMREMGAPSCAASISVQQYVSSTSADHSACVTVSDQQTMPWLASSTVLCCFT